MAAGPERKGTFAGRRLPVSRRYLRPGSRRWMIILGLAGMAAVFSVASLDFLLGDAILLTGGPLSSNHAFLAREGDCEACHVSFDEVSAKRCQVCHEKHGDKLGVYGFDAHALYRSGDPSRIGAVAEEPPCASCHSEHDGEDAPITLVRDGACLSCHRNGPFHTGHPEFDYKADEAGDDAAIRFAHIQHVREVMKREEEVELERVCLYCHNAQPDGRGFEPIDFDRHCDSCHLTSTIATPALPIQSAGVPGVETLEAIRARGGPGTRWAWFANPAELQKRGAGAVRKRPVHHADAWILENLRRLRVELQGDAVLRDLLRAAPSGTDRPRTLYLEAVAALRGQAEELRGHPDPALQKELRQIEQLLVTVERRLEDPETPLDPSRFSAAATGNASADRDEILQLVADLTEPCQGCHEVAEASIVRPQADQVELVRAEFDHRAHILQRRCLDCHDQIPIESFVEDGGEPNPDLDRSAVHNLPAIGLCQECHRPGNASMRCTSCHLFHPNKSRRSELLLYFD